MDITDKISPYHSQFLFEHYGLDTTDPPVRRLIEKGFLLSLTKEEINVLLDRHGEYAVSTGGIKIIYPSHDSNCFTIRLNMPFTDPTNGKPLKYLRPSGQSNRLYVPDGLDLNTLDEIWITEGEMKSLVAFLYDMPVVALPGIWGWRTDKNTTSSQIQKFFTTGKTSGISDEEALIVDLDRGWQGKRFVLIYDSDINQHHRGWPSYGRLAEELYRLGAEDVRVMTLPAINGEKTGLDDLLLQGKKNNLTPNDVISGLNRMIEQQHRWIPYANGLHSFVSRIQTKISPSDQEKQEGILAHLLSGNLYDAEIYAESFGRRKTALLKAAKAMKSKVKKQQSPQPPLEKSLENLYEHILIKIDSMSLTPTIAKELVKKDVFQLIKETFEAGGKFYSSQSGDVWWFNPKQKKMLCFGETEFDTFFTTTTGLAINGDFGADSYKKLFANAYQNGTRITTHRLSYYDSLSNRLYLDLYNGEMLRLDGKIVERLDNGTDEIFFTQDLNWEPWEFIHPTRQDEETFWSLMTGVNLSQSSILHPHCAKIALIAWRLAGFFREKQPTRGHLVLRGNKDSGKSSLARYWLWLLFGVAADVSTINPENLDQFLTLLTNSPWVCIDNLDGDTRKIEDILAIAATGGQVPKRVLYTTNKMNNYPIKSWFTITSRTPRFRRDDIADRLLVIELDQLNLKIPEGIRKELIKTNRNRYMSVLVRELNHLVAYFSENGWPKNVENFRLADFASFLRAFLSSMLGSDNGSTLTDVVLQQLATAQCEFTIQDDLLVELLISLLDKNSLNYDQEYRVSEVLTAVNEEALAQGLRFSIHRGHALTAMLRERMHAASISGRLNIEVTRSTLPGFRGSQSIIIFSEPQGSS